jgi:hypothetical protein
MLFTIKVSVKWLWERAIPGGLELGYTDGSANSIVGTGNYVLLSGFCDYANLLFVFRV